MKSLLMALVALITNSQALHCTPFVEHALEATVILRSAGPEDRFLGSGFVLESEGVIVSNAHVVGQAAQVTVQYRNNTRELAQVIAVDEMRDIAVIRIKSGRGGLNAAPTMPTIGDEVTAVGAPLGLGFTATRGIIAADPRQIDVTVPLRLIQHDAAINPGSSGGALVDAEGRLVGMNSQIADGSRYYVGISYAITAQDIQKSVQRLLAGSDQLQPALGLDLRALSRPIALALVHDECGVLVEHVDPGSATEVAGMRAGDILETLGGAPICTPAEVAFRLETLSAQDMISADISRAGRHLNLTIPVVFKGAVRPEAPPTRAPMPLINAGLEVDASHIIARVAQNSAAFRAGFAIGDHILMANSSTRIGDTLVAPTLFLVRGESGRTRHIFFDPWSKTRVFRPAGGGNAVDTNVAHF